MLNRKSMINNNKHHVTQTATELTTVKTLGDSGHIRTAIKAGPIKIPASEELGDLLASEHT